MTIDYSDLMVVLGIDIGLYCVVMFTWYLRTVENLAWGKEKGK